MTPFEWLLGVHEPGNRRRAVVDTNNTFTRPVSFFTTQPESEQSLLMGHPFHQVENTLRVAPLVVIPGKDFEESGV